MAPPVSTEPLCTLTAHMGDVNCVTFNDHFLATCSGDKTVRLWQWSEAASRQQGLVPEAPQSPLLGHDYYVNFCRFSPILGSDQLVTCSTDGRIIWWNARSGSRGESLSHPSQSGVRVAAFSQDGEYLATGCEDGSICVWKCNTAATTAPPFLLRSYSNAHESMVLGLCFPPDSDLLVSCSSVGDIRIWRTSQNAETSVFRKPDCHDLGVTAMDVCPDYDADIKSGRQDYLIATGGHDSLIVIWTLISERSGGAIRMVSRTTLRGHSMPVNCCVFSRDGRLLGSCSGDHLVIIWDPISGGQLHRIEAHSRYVTSVAFSPDMRLLASGSNDRTVRLWRLILPDGACAEAPEPLADFAPTPGQPPRLWSVERVVHFVNQLGLPFIAGKVRLRAVNGSRLLDMRETEMVQELGIVDPPTRTQLVRAVNELRNVTPDTYPAFRMRIRPPTMVAPEAPPPVSAPPVELPFQAEVSGLPEEFFCPITCEVMRDPVIAADGFSYERRAIEDWLSRGRVLSPMTCEPLSSCSLLPNRSLRQLIQRMKENPPTTQ